MLVAVSVPIGAAQVSVRLLTLAVGTTVLEVTVVLVTAVQPLADVSVTLYTPDNVVLKLAVVWPLLHRNVTPGVVLEAETVTVVSVHVSGPVLVAVTFWGAVMS